MEPRRGLTLRPCPYRTGSPRPRKSRAPARETGRRTRADDLAFVAPDVAEAMRQRALEIIGIAGAEHPRLAADGEFDFSLDDHTTLLAGVRQHLLAGIRVRRIAFVQDRHGAFGQTAAD